MKLRAIAIALAAALSAAAGATTAPLPISLAEALGSQLGRWEGQLEYRDYSANQWFGLPVKVSIAEIGDGVTQLRIADFDDGPAVGNVRITSLTMLDADGETEWTSTFRKGRAAELVSARLALTAAVDAENWTIVALSEARDDNRPAHIRITTTRAGDSLMALKEVDFSDDAEETWLQRNRQMLRRVGD